MNEVGVGDGSVAASRWTSALFGIGTALILDEFALLLNLRDVYWQHDGYSSFPALTTFAAILLLATLGRPFTRRVGRHHPDVDDDKIATVRESNPRARRG